jgi:hypothetical protein
MDAAVAARRLSKFTFKPDWDLRFTSQLSRIEMQVDFVAWESTPDPYYGPHKVVIHVPPVTFDVSGLTWLEVQRVALSALIEIDTHDDREFWRDENGKATYHPHHQDGEDNWQNTASAPMWRYPNAVAA